MEKCVNECNKLTSLDQWDKRISNFLPGIIVFILGILLVDLYYTRQMYAVSFNLAILFSMVSLMLFMVGFSCKPWMPWFMLVPTFFIALMSYLVITN